MRDTFTLELGPGAFASSESVFPAFYGQDFIIFGLENDIVEAVRLGEKVMSENGYVLSLELQKAVKNYLVQNSEKYNQAIKKTGPIDNTSLYRKVKEQQNYQAAPVMMSLDDPYWQNFIDNNSRRNQQWRIPSHLAWTHKPYGIAGEVIDMKKINDTQQKMAKYL